MNKRIIIKTTLICFGVFIILCSIITWLLTEKYEFGLEKEYQVVIAKTDISPGMVISNDMIGLKTIKESAFNEHMVTEPDIVAGTKASAHIEQDDYIRNYVLIPRKNWYQDDERTIVLPMEVEERLANLIKQGTYVDIKLSKKDIKSVPVLVLSKIEVSDVLDENGVSLGSNGTNKKAYARLVLDKNQRDRIYVAMEMGKLIFELYCDTTQNPPVEEFQIPEEYMKKVSVGKLPVKKFSEKRNQGVVNFG